MKEYTPHILVGACVVSQIVAIYIIYLLICATHFSCHGAFSINDDELTTRPSQVMPDDYPDGIRLQMPKVSHGK